MHKPSPSEIENELAVGVIFEPRGRGCGDPSVVLQHDEMRSPAGLEADAAAIFQRCQKLMAQKRVATVIERIPFGCG